ncbi:hypothetical protein QEN19_003923 [Hanseniaspora menglaensis]
MTLKPTIIYDIKGMSNLEIDLSDDSSNLGDITLNKPSISEKQERLNNLLQQKLELEDELASLQAQKAQQDDVVSKIDDNIINNFIKTVAETLQLDLISDSFAKENVTLDSVNFDLILFDCEHNLEDVVTAAVDLEFIELDRWEDINVLFLKLQCYFHLRYSIFTAINNESSDIEVNFIEGIVSKNNEILFQWDILVSNRGLLVQNKLSTPILSKQEYLKNVICSKGIYEGVQLFIQ